MTALEFLSNQSFSDYDRLRESCQSPHGEKHCLFDGLLPYWPAVYFRLTESPRLVHPNQLQPFQLRAPWCIRPIPTASAIFNQGVIDVSAIGQDDIPNGALVLIVAVRLERDFFPIDRFRGRLLRSLAVCLALLRTVDAAEANAFCMGIVQDFDRVAVKDGGDGGGEVGSEWFDQ